MKTLSFIKNKLSVLRRRLVENSALVIGPIAIQRTAAFADLHARLQMQEYSLKSYSESGGRSVVFVNNSYYNFFYLAAALRKRGWKALSVNLEDPRGAQASFYHGWDVCLYDADPFERARKTAEFLQAVLREYRMVHFYGMGHLTFFSTEVDSRRTFENLPFDLVQLRSRGIKVGYSVSGCLDGVAQASVREWSGCCSKCVWQDRPDICSDLGNLAWGHKMFMLCDLIATEGFPALDYQKGPKVFREPLTTALDPNLWTPELVVPENLKLKRVDGELIVYHAVGNYCLRSKGGRNLKGTHAVVEAIDRLRSEGFKVRLEFATGIASSEVRFLQVQADIIVDQLNYGRYGATAREGMMLGKPTICYINRSEPQGEERLQSIESCPLVSANEDTLYSALRTLLQDEELRLKIGRESREFAVKWHSADACAERFERVYDILFSVRTPAGNAA